MQKTRKSIAKRFKITGSGKIVRRTPGKRHRNRFMTNKQSRNARKDKAASPGISKIVIKGAPFLR